MRLGTQEMFGVLEVKGEATEASSSDKEMPLWALFRAWWRRSRELNDFWGHQSLWRCIGKPSLNHHINATQPMHWTNTTEGDLQTLHKRHYSTVQVSSMSLPIYSKLLCVTLLAFNWTNKYSRHSHLLHRRTFQQNNCKWKKRSMVSNVLWGRIKRWNIKQDDRLTPRSAKPPPAGSSDREPSGRIRCREEPATGVAVRQRKGGGIAESLCHITAKHAKQSSWGPHLLHQIWEVLCDDGKWLSTHGKVVLLLWPRLLSCVILHADFYFLPNKCIVESESF